MEGMDWNGLPHLSGMGALCLEAQASVFPLKSCPGGTVPKSDLAGKWNPIF